MKKLVLLLCAFTLCLTLVACTEVKEISYEDHVTEAINFISSSFTKEELDLPADFTDYSLIPDDDYTDIVNGNKMICINVYCDLGTRMELMGIYYYDIITKEVYKINYLSGDYEIVEHIE